MLRPGGWLAVVYPGTDHMAELRPISGCCGSTNLLPNAIARQRRFDRSTYDSPAPQADRSRRCGDPQRDTHGSECPTCRSFRLNGELTPIAVTFDFIMLFARRSDGRSGTC